MLQPIFHLFVHPYFPMQRLALVPARGVSGWHRCFFDSMGYPNCSWPKISGCDPCCPPIFAPDTPSGRLRKYRERHQASIPHYPVFCRNMFRHQSILSPIQHCSQRSRSRTRNLCALDGPARPFIRCPCCGCHRFR